MADFKVKNGLQAKRYLQTTTAISNAALTVTYRVTVANPGSGNKYYIDGVLQTSITLYEGVTYIFDQSDSTNASHPLRFSETANGTHASGSAYTTGVTTGGTPGSAGSFTQIVVASGAPTLYTYCTNHSLMGFTTTTVASLVVDLNKGNNFSITPSGNQTFAFTNPPATGKAQAFSIEVTGGSNGMSDIFSTTLYTGNNGANVINNGLNLSGDGGLVWTKVRSNAYNHHLFDTARGTLKRLRSDSREAESSTNNSVTSFNNNGFTVNNSSEVNNGGWTYVSWAWKKASNFFDIVTYTGNGSVRNISHNLGSVPGMIIVKCTSAGSSYWTVYHRALDASSPEDKYVYLDSTNAVGDFAAYWNDTAPTSSVFTLGAGNGDDTNADGETYVAYLFAHNSESVNCGTYTGNGSATGPVVTTGFQPQWLMFKCTSNADDWVIVDAQRGIDPAGNDIFLKPNTTGADYGFLDAISVSSTGFNVTGTDNVVNGSGRTYIYMAIAANAAGSLTWPTEVKYPAGTAPTSPSLGKKDTFNFMTVDGGTSYLGKKAVEGLS